MHDCLRLTAFGPAAEDPELEYSAKGNVYRSKLNNVVLVQRSVELIEEERRMDLFTLAETEHIPELDEVPSSL